MISGGASAAQKAEGYGQQMNMEHMGSMEAAFAQQENMHEMNRHFDEMNLSAAMMTHEPHVAEYHHPTMSKMNDLWDQPLEKVQDVSHATYEDRFSSVPQYSHGMFGLPGMMGQMYHPPMNSMPYQAQPIMKNPNEEVKVEEIKEEVVKEDPQMYGDEMKEVTGGLISDLSMAGLEKINNSQFMSFLKKLNTGALKINDNGLEEDSAKIKEFEEKEARMKAMDAAYYKSEIDRIVEETKDPERYFKIEDAMNQKQFDNDALDEFDPTNMFRDVWDAGELNEDELQRMMSNWKQMAMKSEGYYDETIKEQPVETIIQVPKIDLFKFDEVNPYKEVEDAYTLAWQLNEDLKVHDAIMALQAHLTKNPDHSPSWRLLGQLYQENDEDDKAIAYFLKAYDLDPYDLESLLCLGVSCTNELKETVALDHLLNWLKYNPEYWDFQFPLEGINDADALRYELRRLFNQALDKNPGDVDVLVCLGVIEFGERNYGGAAKFFGAAIRENPSDYNLWNKYGAGLANNLWTKEALDIYHQALELRPNLVRTWANIGIAYWNMDRYAEAAGKFLNALALNPTADHIWQYLHSWFWALKEFDKWEMVKKKNIELFRGEYDILNPEMLPKPSMDKLFSHPHLSSSD